MNRLIISGASSGVGKTTVTNALLSILRDVQPFKIGPDFIDPMLHQHVTGKPSYNLDSYIYSEDTIKYLFHKNAGKLNILEGVMGLYDGLNHSLENHSTAQMSRILDCPVIIVIDGKKQATSLAAHVKGLIELDPRVKVAGVILNRTTEGSYQYLKAAIEQHTNIQCLGYLPDNENFKIKERHLGLMQAAEIKDLDEKIKELAKVAQRTLDIEAILKIASKVPKVEVTTDLSIKDCHLGKKVAIAKDEAFSFFYQSHLDLFIESGAEIVYFSPINDSTLPQADLYIFPGGYPELYLEKLQSNREMIKSVVEVCKTKKVIAECGGFIYLSKGIWYQEEFYPLCGVYDIEIEFTGKLDFKRFGYINVLHNKMAVRGHEFHYSTIKECNENEAVYIVTNKNYSCGYQKANTIAGYPHLLYYSNLDYFKKLLEENNEN